MKQEVYKSQTHIKKLEQELHEKNSILEKIFKINPSALEFDLSDNEEIIYQEQPSRDMPDIGEKIRKKKQKISEPNPQHSGTNFNKINQER